VGTVLLFGMILSSVALIALLGAGPISDLQEQSRTDRAEDAMAQVSSQASMVALGGSSAQRIEFAESGEGQLSVRESGSLEMVVDNESVSDETVLNVSLGAVVYATDSTEVAYQGGGVWRMGDGEARMLSPPQFHYQGTTLTLPVVNVTGSGTASGTPAVTVTGGATEEAGPPSPVEGSVNVTVTSAYYTAWGEYFEDRTDGAVVYDDANESVTLQLVAQSDDDPEVDGSVVSMGNGQMDFDNKVLVNSYNSSTPGSTPSGKGKGMKNGDIVVASDLKLNSGQVNIEGDVYAGGTVTVGNQPTIDGDLYCAAGNHGCLDGDPNTDVNGDVINWSNEINAPPPVEDVVGASTKAKIDEIANSNDNDDAGDISGDVLVDDDDLVLDGAANTSQYYLEKIELDDSKTLTLNTSAGDIELAVGGNVHLDDADIIVEGDGTVRTFADVGKNGNGDVDFDNGATVQTQELTGNNQQYESDRFWLFSPPGIDADIQSQNTEITGVVYAPDESGAGGAVDITGATVNGAIIAQVTSADEGNQKARIHYDEALSDTEATASGSADPPEVTYMQVTVNDIEVDVS
jgi:hypothetical protein